MFDGEVVIYCTRKWSQFVWPMILKMAKLTSVGCEVMTMKFRGSQASPSGVPLTVVRVWSLNPDLLRLRFFDIWIVQIASQDLRVTRTESRKLEEKWPWFRFLSFLVFSGNFPIAEKCGIGSPQPSRLSMIPKAALLQGCVILLASFTIEIAVSFCEKLRNVSYDTHNVFRKVVQWHAWKFHTILFSFFLVRSAHVRLLLISRDRPRPAYKRVDDRYDRFAPISARVSSFIGSLYPP